jgi:hypothetical protein
MFSDIRKCYELKNNVLNFPEINLTDKKNEEPKDYFNDSGVCLSQVDEYF